MLRSTSYPQMAHRMKCCAPRGTDQRNHPGTGWDVRCMRSKRSVGTCPAERLLLSPSDLPERQPAILCSSQRDQHGWWQRVPILSERKGKIAAKSCSYAHNRRMSHPRTHLQRFGSPDTEDNDRVHHPQTGNDRNQKETDKTASWKRCDRPWFALLEITLLVKCPGESLLRGTPLIAPLRQPATNKRWKACGDQHTSYPLGSEAKI